CTRDGLSWINRYFQGLDSW
nr:immunoglobulin heavy chain junction region [Macaca mulatta]